MLLGGQNLYSEATSVNVETIETARISQAELKCSTSYTRCIQIKCEECANHVKNV